MNTAEALEKITKKDLQVWLESKQPDEAVGYEHRACYCPLSIYFKERHGIDVQIGNLFDFSTFHLIGDMKGVDLPHWMREFAESVDEGEASEVFGKDENGFDLFRPVAKSCLEILTTL